MEPLQTMDQHGTVGFVQNVLSDLDGMVGPNTDQVLVERSMMKLAESQAVGDCRLTPRVVIRENMGGVQELLAT